MDNFLPSGQALTQVVHTGPSGYPHLKAVSVQAGRAYHRRCKNACRGRSASHDSTELAAAVKNQAKEVERKILKRYKKSIRNKDFCSLSMYQQLGLTDLMYDATEAQVKLAYRRVLIEHHPDKTGKTENDPSYLAVQKAFTTLMDQKKRRAYDSQCDFDEKLPKDSLLFTQNVEFDDSSDKERVCFYDTYGPVFDRNARFSAVKPVPRLGDASTDISEVYAFYDFWLKFDSWRDFSHDEEDAVGNAEHRNEKRFLAKKKIAEAKLAKKNEYLRLEKLHKIAFKNDPRIKREKADVKAHKAALVQEKADLVAAEEAKVAAVLAQVAAAEAAIADAAKDASKSAKADKDKAKKALRKLKKLLRELMDKARSEDAAGALSLEETETVCETVSLETITTLLEELGGAVATFNADGVAAVRAQLS